MCISFFNCDSIYFLVNIYLDLSQIALKYLKNTKANINNVLIMTGDFNIRDNIWDPNFPHCSIHSDFLTDIANSINLSISRSTNQVPTKYSDNQNNLNSVIDLMFLRLNLLELDNYTIHLEWRLSSDHTPLTVDIAIMKEHIQTRKCTLVKNSKEEENFITELIRAITRLNTENIPSKEVLEQIIQKFTNEFKYSKVVNITKHSKVW